MHPKHDDFYLFTVLWLGGGGSLLALAGMWLERHFGRRANRIFGGTLLSILSVTAAVLWSRGQPVEAFGPFLGLASVCLAVVAVQSSVVRLVAKRLLRPGVIWAVLLVAGPVLSLVYAYRINRPEPLPPLMADPGPGIHRDAKHPLGVTDLGREIELFQYDAAGAPEALGGLLIEQEALTQKVIRIAGPDAACNCHGWVFTGGKYGVASEDVGTILADNGYEVVDEPREGDIVIYRDGLGRVQHTGLVRFVGTDGLVLVESKWGSLGIYLHTPKDQPYGAFYNYRRSSRPGHELHLKSR